MKLHWSPKSPFVRKVMVAAHELGVAHQLTLVRTVAAMSTCNADLMVDNPLNKIPTLVLADGESLFDSLVICEYLDNFAAQGRRTGGVGLFPLPGPDRFRALTLHALADGMLNLLILWRNERDKPPSRRSSEWIDAFTSKCRASLDRLETLAPSLTSTPFGIGHVGVGCCLSYIDFRFPDMAWRCDRAQLASWQNLFQVRPSAVATQIHDG